MIINTLAEHFNLTSLQIYILCNTIPNCIFCIYSCKIINVVQRNFKYFFYIHKKKIMQTIENIHGL